ncbi:MAG: hypothetical protein NC483_02990 [Ruminococcus sp.]|nr:hypothetical protein [Ruminococcus sp.]
MEKNKIILSYCPNFNKIVNTDFLEGDSLSLQLVKIYKDFIFKINLDDLEDINRVQDIDKTMGKYVDDYFFRKTLQEELAKVKLRRTAEDIINSIVENLIHIFKRYEEETTRKIYVSKWI